LKRKFGKKKGKLVSPRGTATVATARKGEGGESVGRGKEKEGKAAFRHIVGREGVLLPLKGKIRP